MGRVAVIGGSEDYTGAPYFSAMASARLGADMVSLTIISSFTTAFEVSRSGPFKQKLTFFTVSRYL